MHLILLFHKHAAYLYYPRKRPQLLWYHTKSEMFVIWRIGIVLYFRNLSLKHFFPHRKRQILWKYPNPETVIVPCFNAFAHAKSTFFPIEDRRQCASVCLTKRHLPFLSRSSRLIVLGHLDERLDELLTKKIDAKARFTEISVNDLIGHWQ